MTIIDRPRVQVTSGSVVINADNVPAMTLPFLWLRDNCDCNECRIVQTSEKKFMLSDVSVDIHPESVTLDGTRLSIVWPDNHQTIYDLDEIRALAEPRHKPWRIWPDEFQPAQVNWTDFLQSNDATRTALQQFLVDGALVITAAPTKPGTLELLASELGPVREVLFARIHDVTLDARGYNVAHTALPLPPHNDFASLSWPPSVQALHMLENRAQGGNTIIVDGWAALEALKADHPDYFDVLCRVPVPFSMFDDRQITWADAPLVRRDCYGNISGLRFSNQLMQTIDPARHDVAAFYRAYHELCTRIASTTHRAVFRLESGHILLVAGHRVLHAREQYEATGKRHLQDAYFELDNVANRLVVLRRKKVQNHVR